MRPPQSDDDVDDDIGALNDAVSPTELHPVLARQLRRSAAGVESQPASEDWSRFLEGVNRAYVAADQDRYTLERAIDISSREMEELHVRLRDERDKLDSVISSLPIGLIELDQEFCLTHANPAACRMLEISQSMLGLRLSSVVTFGVSSAPLSSVQRDPISVPPDSLNGDELLNAMLEKQLDEAVQDVRIIAPSGHTVPCAVMHSPIMRGRERTGLLLLITDMRAVRDAELRAREARVVAETARRSAELKSQFLATMSHEIRTPMNGVLGMLQLLLDTDLSDEQREFASTSYRSAEGLLSILNDILDFSKLEAGRYELETVEFGITDLVTEVVRVFGERARGKRISLAWTCSPEIPEPVLGDVTRVRQVLTNLVSNAVKFTDAGGVTVSVDVEPEPDGSLVFCFTVVDTGIGISESALAGLFNVFTQADVSTTRKYGGTGLGLAISKRLSELMGGTLTCESTLGQGTRFAFKLALQPAANASRVSDLREQLGGRRLLVVDDGANQREMLRELLERWGIRVDLASSAYEALGMAVNASRRGSAYHGVLVDERMPKIGGAQLVGMLEQEECLTALKVVLMGPRLDRRAGNKLSGSGITVAHIQKPVLQAELRAVLVEHLRWSSHERAARLARDLAGESSARWVTDSEAPPSSRGTVLVVDDNVVNRVLAKKVVEKLGYGADLVENGQEAVDAVVANKYVAVLMDCMMPVMDGYAATACIRGHEDKEGKRRIPIIGLTADAVVGARERVLSAGMDDYVSKPIRTDDIKVALNRWCGMD